MPWPHPRQRPSGSDHSAVTARTRQNGLRLAAGSAFVQPAVRQSLLGAILAALVSARKATRAALKDEVALHRRAVLDSRQKALKLCANALVRLGIAAGCCWTALPQLRISLRSGQSGARAHTRVLQPGMILSSAGWCIARCAQHAERGSVLQYGFTGAQASPLQCIAVADSCLALGAASCRWAARLTLLAGMQPACCLCTGRCGSHKAPAALLQPRCTKQSAAQLATCAAGCPAQDEAMPGVQASH